MLRRTSTDKVSPLRKSRKYGTKVKTGCQTCKIRRVKCDEKRPACARCTSTGRKCDGYTQDASFGFEALVPSQLGSVRTSIPILSGLGDSVIYLEFYHHCASPTLASNFDREFWSHTVLQMAYSEPSVRHALIALSYLVKTMPGNLKHARSISGADSHTTLLVHYNKAVRSLVERATKTSHSVEVGLITCLLFICIEFLRGDYLVAFTHLQSGLKIIAEWQRRPQQAPHDGTTYPLYRDAIGRRVVGSEMNAHKIVPMFIRLMTSGMLFGAPIDSLVDILCPCPRDFQGRSFTTVQDAQIVIFELRNATIIFTGVLTRKLLAYTEITNEDLQYRAHLLTCHESWRQAMKVLENEGNLSKQDSLVASSLRLSHYATYVALAGATDIYQMSYDAHIADFEALNHHARIVLDSMNSPSSSPGTPATSLSPSASSDPKGPAAHFKFEIASIPPLYFAAIRCRCPTTRRESVSLLARNPPREALWDAEQHALVARRVIEIEESEVDEETGRPAQRTRLANAILHGDMDKNGGFWVTFATAEWIARGCTPRDTSRCRPDAHPGPREDSEWDEWFMM